MSHRSAEEQSLGAPPPLRFKGAVAAIGAAVGCRTGGCAATVAATDGLPGIRPFCGGRVIFVEIEDF